MTSLGKVNRTEFNIILSVIGRKKGAHAMNALLSKQ